MKSFKRIICAIMALVLCIAVCPAQNASAAGAPLEIIFDSADAQSAFNSASGCSLSFDKNESSLFVLSKGAAPSAILPINGYRAGYNYAVVTYRAPKANSGGASKMTLDFQSGGKSAYTTSFYYSVGCKYYSTVVDIRALMSADSVKITFFSGAVSGDSLHLYGISFFETKDEAKLRADELSLAATGDIVSRYSEAALASDSYVEEDYMIPYWDADIIFNENVYPLLNPNGTIDDITLMYDASRIVNVKNYGLNVEYKEGVDYELVDGKLRILTSGNIPCVKYSEHYFKNSAPYTYAMIGGGYVRFQEGTAIPSIQLAITYVHEDEWKGPIPENKGESLPETRKKLEGGSQLRIVFFGDSITNGGNSSKDINMAPYADTWVEMLEDEINSVYPHSNIVCENTSVSGGSVETAVQNLRNAIINRNPDLLILALGTNDYQFQYSTSKVVSEMRYVVDTVKKECPQCEIIIVSPMLSNPECFDRNLLYEYREGYRNIVNSYSGMALADVTEIHDYLLTRKSYTDMSANNLCHLNDFFARVYGHTIMKTITAKGASSSFKMKSKLRLSSMINTALYFDDELAQAREIERKASAEIDSAETFEEIRAIIYDAKTLIRALPQKREAAEKVTDFTRIMFNDSIYTALFGGAHDLSVSHDANERSAVLTATNAYDPYISLMYSSLYPIGADENKYVVFTYKSVMSDPSKFTRTELYFRSGSEKDIDTGHKYSFATKSDGEYHSVVIDLSEATWWTGVMRQIKIDPYTSCSVGDSMCVYSLSLCSNEEEAKSVALLNERKANGVSYDITYFTDGDSVSAISPLTLVRHVGDVDANGRVNALDYRKLLLCLAGETGAEYSPYYDVRLDGIIDTKDSLQLRSIAAGEAHGQVVSEELTFPDVSFSYAESAALIEGKTNSFALISGESPVGTPKYAVVTYKSGMTKNSKIDLYFDEKIVPDFKTTVDIKANGIYNYIIVKIPDVGFDGKTVMALGDTSLFIDSVGYFEDETTAENYAASRLALKNYVPSENIVLTFTGENVSRLKSPNNTALEYSEDTGIVKFKVTGNGSDPYIYFDLSDFNISADEYKYIIYEYMVPATNSALAKNAQLFMCSGNYAYPAEAASVRFDLTVNGEYQKQVFDMTSRSFWSGNVYGIRIDYFQAARVNDLCYVKSIVLCKSLEDANELLGSKAVNSIQ